MNKEEKYKTFEELKEELGDKFEEYMYKSNIELLKKIDKVINEIDRVQQYLFGFENTMWAYNDLQYVREILKGDSND